MFDYQPFCNYLRVRWRVNRLYYVGSFRVDACFDFLCFNS